MRRILAAMAVTCWLSGCASDSAAWNEVKKDLRGDNSRMRTESWDRGELPKGTMSAH
jgi:hypothetical protein